MQTYIPLNKGNTHWVSVVMHRPKEEFQVLDPLMGRELDSKVKDKVEELVRFKFTWAYRNYQFVTELS